MGRKLTAAATVPPFTPGILAEASVDRGEDDGHCHWAGARGGGGGAPGPISRRMIHAVPGRSLK